MSADESLPPRRPRLDRHGNPPPPRRPQPPAAPPAGRAQRQLPPNGAPARPAARRPSPSAQPEEGRQAPLPPPRPERQYNDPWDTSEPTRPRKAAKTASSGAEGPSGSLDEARHERAHRAERVRARPRPRRDPATYQPVYVNSTADRARNGFEWIMVAVVAFSVALLVKTFVMEAYVIPSGSMEPTLEIHDRVVVNKLSYDYGNINYGDVVVFKRPPGATQLDASVHNLIKRVIGKPGDTLEAKDGIVYRNGQIVDESYLPPGTETEDLPATTVPPGQLFFMGDNRGNSDDSRYIGTVSESLVIGKAEARVWPISRIAGL